MDSERWRRMESIFQSALDCEPGRRAALLDAACAGDRELRQEIESLLASYRNSGFAETWEFPEVVEILDRRAQRVSPGKQIGPYEILRETDSIDANGFVSVLGRFRPDGAGKWAINLDVSGPGGLSFAQASGSYTVNADGSGMLEFPVGDGRNHHLLY